MVIHTDTVINPGAMADFVSIASLDISSYSLIMFSYTAIASLAMFTSEWHAYHTRHAKIMLIKLPEAQQLINDRFLLCQTSKFWNIARLIDHRACVKIGA